MQTLTSILLSLLTSSVLAAGLPGAPGSVTPQPYAPTPQVPLLRGAERPPLLPVLPPAKLNQPPPELRTFEAPPRRTEERRDQDRRTRPLP